MIALSILLISLLLLPVIVDGLMLALWVFKVVKPAVNSKTKPKVSILVAARNEEVHLGKCIEGLLSLKYPSHLVEILIGDDASTDQTFEVAKKFSRTTSIQVYKIEQQLSGLQGKANVLAQLARRAGGEYLFFTDADVVVPSGWIEGMLTGFDEKVGLVSGVTGIKGRKLWSVFQFIDWVFAIGLVKVVNDMGYSVTALGNNMAVSRSAYEAVGGYENIPFSVTEDFELLKQIRTKGFTGNQLFSKKVLAWSAPEPGWKRLLNQRKRWMKGAIQLPVAIVIILSIQAVFFPAFFLLVFLNLSLALFILAIKVVVQAIFIGYALRKLGQKEKVITLILYEFYSAALSLSLLVFYFLPMKINWKERKY